MLSLLITEKSLNLSHSSHHITTETKSRPLLYFKQKEILTYKNNQHSTTENSIKFSHFTYNLSSNFIYSLYLLTFPSSILNELLFSFSITLESLQIPNSHFSCTSKFTHKSLHIILRISFCLLLREILLRILM